MIKDNREIIEKFKSSVKAALDAADQVKKIPLNDDYKAAVVMFHNIASIANLAFSNNGDPLADMLFFGRTGGHVGIPMIEEWDGEGDSLDE